MEYNPRNIEQKWQKWWSDHKINEVSNESDKPKYYVLDMFPYPSGAGLHVGHPLGYIASDIYSRYKRLKGFNVLHPMGFDAFGLPAEQYAIQTGVHPAISTEENIAKYKSQLTNLGLSFDWSREVITSDPKYYKWTQWIFLQLFDHYYDIQQQKPIKIAHLIEEFEKSGNENVKASHNNERAFSAEEWNRMSLSEKDSVLMDYRLAYRKQTYVNWCEELGTVLANDEVKDGVSERGGFPVVRRPMLQWSLRITAYAERLLRDMDNLEWSHSLKTMQSNWIGRSEGARVYFPIEGFDQKLEIFTTRPDTIFGATFMVLAPEHPYVLEITNPDQRVEVEAYMAQAGTKSEIERKAGTDKITGANTGAFAIHPFNGKKIPIWISEYVLMDYGTGAIMSVPSDDERDQKFAEHFGLEIIPVVDKTNYPDADLHDKVGVLINSDFLNGLEVIAAIEKVIKEIERRNIGWKEVNYKLRDANFSRQRYWGEPFPIIYTPEGESKALPESSLPLELPNIQRIEPSSDGKSPLASVTDWVELDNGSTRETDTMPGYAGSSWYFLRYMDPGNENAFASKSALQYWRDVDLYIGGTEHAVGHLLYSRFWHKFLYDKGLVPTEEPFKKLINQGMIQGVIEYIYLMKEKFDGNSKFLCSRLADNLNIQEDQIARIPVHVDFVMDYGTKQSHLTIDSIKKFIDWRPEYKDAIFECSKGVFHKGIFKPKGQDDGSHLFTHSEVGKMSKRYFNVVNPDDVVEKYGADCFRMYEMFLGPIEHSKPWDIKGIDGVSKFLRRFWSLYFNEQGDWLLSSEKATSDELKVLHSTIKKVTEDIERFAFNTCVSSFMVCVNDLKKLRCHKSEILSDLLILIAPFAPHLAEEIWHKMGNEISVMDASYPVFNPALLVEDSITYPIAINGKKRGEFAFPSDATVPEIQSEVVKLDLVVKWVDGKEIRKIIVVPKRMVNIVV